jgi:hypothetical protein
VKKDEKEKLKELKFDFNELRLIMIILMLDKDFVSLDLIDCVKKLSTP